jgi:Immunity protein 26
MPSVSRLKVGDIFEIPLKKSRFAYAQCIYIDRGPDGYGPLMRIFDPITKESLDDAESIAQMQTAFYAFSGFNTKHVQERVRKLGNVTLSKKDAEPPMLKTTGDLKRRRSSIWFLWTPKGLQEISSLPRKYDGLSLLQYVNLLALVDRIEKGWRPKDEISEES